MPDPISLLINNRFAPADFAIRRFNHQISEAVPGHTPSPPNLKLNEMGVGTRCDDKVILKLPLIAVVDQIHTGVNLLVSHLAVGWNAGALRISLFTDEIVGFGA